MNKTKRYFAIEIAYGVGTFNDVKGIRMLERGVQGNNPNEEEETHAIGRHQRKKEVILLRTTPKITEKGRIRNQNSERDDLFARSDQRTLPSKK